MFLTSFVINDEGGTEKDKGEKREEERRKGTRAERVKGTGGG